MGRFSLEAVLSFTDQLTGPYKNMKNNITAMNRGLTGSFNRLNNGINKTIGKIGTGLKRATMIGLTALTVATGAAAREFVRLDDVIVSAGAKFQDLDTTASTFKDSLKELSTAARDVGSDTEFMATDAGGALDKFAMAGFNSVQSMALLRGTTNLATVANTDLTTAVDIATDTLGAFNLVVDDAAQLEINLARASDVMAKTTVTANTSLEDMFEAVKKGGPAFTAAGQQIEDFAALTGVMANSGIKGAEAGTSLRNIMLRLSKPTGEAGDVIKALGVQTQDANGDFLNIVDIIGQFEEGLKGMGTAQRTAALTTVFGARSVTGMNVLLAEGADALGKYRDELIDSSGAAETMATAIRKSLGNRIKILKSGLTELGLQFIEAFETQGRSALDGLITSVQNFDMQPVIDGVKTVAREFRAFVTDIGPSFTEMIGKFQKINMDKVVENLKSVFNIVGDIIPKLIEFGPEILIIAAAIKLWAGAQVLLNSGLLASPLGAFVVSAGALLLLLDQIEKKLGIGKGEGIGSESFELGRRERLAERQEEKRESSPRHQRLAARIEQEKQQREVQIESRQRNDIFLHGPSGTGISETPGGAPQQAVKLGLQ